MGTTPRRESPQHTPLRKKVTSGIVGVVVLSLLAALVPMFMSPANAASVPAVFFDGNRTCSSFGFENEVKLNGAPANGNYNITVDGVSGVFTISNQTGTSFDWSSTIGVDAIFVKAGSGGFLYTYNPPAPSFGDTNLVSPPNNDNPQPAQISHLSICFGDAPVPPVGELTIEKTATPSYSRDFDWTITKDVNATSVTTDQDTATFTYTVNVTKGAAEDTDHAVNGSFTINSSYPVAVPIIDITDAIENDPGAATCVLDFNGAAAGLGTEPTSIAASSAIVVDYSCTFASAAAALATDSNTATVQWTDPDPVIGSRSVSDDAPYSWPDPPLTVTDDCVSVDDLFEGDVTPVVLDGNVCASGPLPTYDRTVDVPATGCTTYDNTATVRETNGPGDSDDASVEVCREYDDLTIDKTADTSFVRDFDWTIDKAVIGPTVITTANNTATFTYRVTATKGAAQDSGHEVDGTITIDNPNDVAVTITDISDSLEPSLTADCALDFNGATAGLGTEPTSIPANGQIVVGYHCTFASAAAALATTTNTATVDWTDPGTLGAKTASDTANYTWGDPDSTTDDCVDVDDAFNGGAPVLLGNVCVTTTFPDYTRTVDVPASGCTDYPNLATVHDTDNPDSDDATVRACRQTNDGFTRGFWTNKNGAKWIQANQAAVQSMLSTYSNVLAGVGSSAASIKATIEGSNSSGDAFTQFRAQFLATALSVLKSPGGALGNQYVSGPGGACKTITEWLVYGNTNYGNGTLLDTKAELLELKDLYDAVNNNVAPLCTP